MSFSVLQTTMKATGANGGATDAIDTTGANLIVVSVGWYSAITTNVTFSDSKGNTWTPLTKQTNSNDASEQLFYCASPTVGSGHTFTATGSSTFPNVYVVAVSGAAASPYDQESGAEADASTIQPGSITPSEDNCLLVTGLNSFTGTSNSVNSGFTALTIDFSGGVRIGGGGAYLIQTSAGAVNPQWSYSGSTLAAAVMASFKADAPPAGGGGMIVGPGPIVGGGMLIGGGPIVSSPGIAA